MFLDFIHLYNLCLDGFLICMRENIIVQCSQGRQLVFQASLQLRNLVDVQGVTSDSAVYLSQDFVWLKLCILLGPSFS